MAKEEIKISDLINKQKDGSGIELAKKALKEYSNNEQGSIDINRFLKGDMTKEISRIFNMRITEYQDCLIKKMAKKRGETVKQMFLNLLIKEYNTHIK